MYSLPPTGESHANLKTEKNMKEFQNEFKEFTRSNKRNSMDTMGAINTGLYFNSNVPGEMTPTGLLTLNKDDEEFLSKFLGHNDNKMSKSSRFKQNRDSQLPRLDRDKK